jgi:hypothetical protein
VTQHRAAGLIFVMVSCVFGLPSLIYYPIGTANKPGPGFYPLVVSSALLLIGLLISFNPGNSPQIEQHSYYALISTTVAVFLVAMLSSHFGIFWGILALVAITTHTTKISKLTALWLILVLTILSAVGKHAANLNFALW